MKIYFGCSTSEFLKYKDYYFAIREYLVRNGHTITRDWLGMYGDDLVNNKEKIETLHKNINRYDKVISAIYKSDLIILEDTVTSFSNGHILTLALQKRTPVLLLRLVGENNPYIKVKFIDSLKSEYLSIKNYTKDTYKEILNEFIIKYSKLNEKNRFNLVISESERDYLDWLQFKTGKSRTKIIRNALKSQIEADKDYSNYINSLQKSS